MKDNFNVLWSSNCEEKLLNSIEVLSHTGQKCYAIYDLLPEFEGQWYIIDLTISHINQISQGLWKIVELHFNALLSSNSRRLT